MVTKIFFCTFFMKKIVIKLIKFLKISLEAASHITSRADSPSISDDDRMSCMSSATNEIVEFVDIEQALKLHEKCQYSKAFKLLNAYSKQNPSSDIAKYWIGLYYYKGYYKSSKHGQKQS